MAAGLVLALAGGSLSGCVSTQHKNARAKLVAARTVDGRRALRIAARSRDVRVLDVSLVRGRRASAVVVELGNGGGRTVTDVPVLVGVRSAGGRSVRVNGGRGLAWFQTHVPAIPARKTTTWVFVRHRPLPQGRPWAVAGAVAAADSRVGVLPRVAASAAPAARKGRGRHAIRVALVNDSDVPQYGLQVFAVARAHGRVVAAGVGSVRHIASRGHASARVALVGAPGRHTIRVHAPATIFE
jgi:hypothetical protein